MLITVISKLKYSKMGDKQEYDFTQADFSKDDNYHDLDLTGIIPTGTKAIQIWGSFKSDTAGAVVQFAQFGHTGTYVKIMKTQAVANIGQALDCIIPVGTDKKIQYLVQSAPNYTYLNINVVAAFLMR